MYEYNVGVSGESIGKFSPSGGRGKRRKRKRKKRKKKERKERKKKIFSMMNVNN